MVDRIRELLQARHLSPTQFADTIGVARPVVSHILSGRNKPSLEVVQKVLAAFPDLSMPWLLTGRGSIWAADAPLSLPLPATGASTGPAPSPPNAAERAAGPLRRPAAARGTKSQQEGPVATPELFSEPSVPTALAEASSIPSLPAEVTTAAATAIATSATSGPDPIAPHLASSVARTIRRVLIFYSDGTFTDFTPAADPL
ncbi:helix-turn-helix domain-containing protein [Hymenobacter sp. B81]|uniref:helix-turn-helix domain-containing protein n=1 Tax=Hymenobacter sp. B81 TaxID=3344878 RepID=UPI0037DC27AE